MASSAPAPAMKPTSKAPAMPQTSQAPATPPKSENHQSARPPQTVSHRNTLPSSPASQKQPAPWRQPAPASQKERPPTPPTAPQGNPPRLPQLSASGCSSHQKMTVPSCLSQCLPYLEHIVSITISKKVMCKIVVSISLQPGCLC